MGRYYETNTGRRGKFMFGVQDSTDPEYMGMNEQERGYIEYLADRDDEQKIRDKLDEQYDILGIPKDKRLYTYKEEEEYDDYEKKHLIDKAFVDVKEDDKKEMEKYKGKTRWYCERKGYVSFEIANNALALARIRLATTILSDIREDGECYLQAEL